MIELHHAPQSPPCRAVRLTAEYIGVDLKLNLINIFQGENQTPEYEKINPTKKIPFLIDGDFKLGESRAIMIYLVEKYGKNSRILPSDPCGRALVNQALQYDSGTLFSSTIKYYYPVMFHMEETYSPERYEKLKDAFGVLDRMVESQDYVAGRNLTIADLSLIASVTTAEALGFEVNKFKNVEKWMDRVKVSIPGYKKINVEGVECLKKFLAGTSEN